MIDQILELVATIKGITKAEAMIMLLTEKVDLKVTLNLFGAAQDISEPLDLFIHGVGSLSTSEARWALPKVTSVRDITEAGVIYSEDVHNPIQALKAYVQDRDGHCRFPGCEENKDLQFHHVIAFDRGGPTTATNLACMCQHHHNKLTGGAAKTYMIESGVCVWKTQSRTLLETEPEGPLADPKRFRFVVTRKEHLRNKSNYWRARKLTENQRPPKPKVVEIFLPEPREEAMAA